MELLIFLLVAEAEIAQTRFALFRNLAFVQTLVQQANNKLKLSERIESPPGTWVYGPLQRKKSRRLSH